MIKYRPLYPREKIYEEEVIAVAIHSDSESTALTYVSIFETLLVQNDTHYQDQQQQNKKRIISNEKDA